MALRAIQDVGQSVVPVKTDKSSGQTQDINFGDILKQAISKVNELEKDSDKITNDFIAGRADSIHEVMIASEKAFLSLQFMVEIKNKLMDAYQEIMRMQV